MGSDMKKGFAAWLSSKLSVLVFAMVLFMAFFSFYLMQSNFQSFDKLAKETENLARVIDSAGASPYYLETNFGVVEADKIVVERISGLDYLKMYSGERYIERGLHVNVEAITIENSTSVKVVVFGNIVKLSGGT